MSLTRAELVLTVNEIAATIAGGVVERVDDLGDDVIALEVYAGRADHHVLLSAKASFSRAHLLDARPPRASAPSAFVMLLRKRLIGARIQSFVLWGDDRVLRLHARGKDEEATLIAELTGRHANLFLVEGPDDVVVASSRANVSSRRALLPGQPYVYPLPTDAAAAALQSVEGGAPPRISAEAPSRDAAALYARLQRRADREAVAQQVGRALRETRKRLERRVKAIAADRARAQDAAPLHHQGTLLVSEMFRLRRGQTEARVTDWSLDPPAEVVIALDPALSPKANVERLFARYRKYKDGQVRIAQQQAGVQAELAHLEALEARAALANAEEDDAQALSALTLFLEELRKRGVVRARQPAPSRAARVLPAEPFRRFVAQDGKAILVGKGAANNDKLTFKHARGNDLWLHARDYPGAHVVLPLARDEDPHPETLLDAATLAAHYSEAKGATVVDVAVTHCKHVRKVKGGAPGLVTMSESRTLAVRMEPERLARLFRKQTLD